MFAYLDPDLAGPHVGEESLELPVVYFVGNVADEKTHDAVKE